ncbi:MAG: hypothetical protein A2X82_13095 [Geobacteraceae bacterium GWC2_55_20]|nr:MAG: hypothetical protein A2X82_13095 [Geobacteraceae bacterium GWC2_55_20]
MDNGVRNQLANCKLRKHGNFAPQRLSNDLIAGQQIDDKADQSLKSACICQSLYCRPLSAALWSQDLAHRFVLAQDVLSVTKSNIRDNKNCY